MNRAIDFTKLGGLYVYQDTLDFLQIAYSQALDAIAACYGEKVIVSGLQTIGGNVSDGWVVLNGQLLPVVGGAIQSYLFLETLVTAEQFADGVQRNVYTTKRLKFTSVSGGNYLFTDFARVPFATASLKDALQTIQTLFSRLLFDEPVILSGCAISGLNEPDTRVTIAAGTVWMDGKMISAPVYNNGLYPAYLLPNATYTTALPGAGSYITFDYETSQRYAHVLKRKTASTGETVMHSNNSELQFFDVGTGLGKWKWKDWKLSEVLRSRSPLGYDNRTVQPVGDDNEAWDATYNTVGNKGGKKKHQLTQAELPHVQLKSGLSQNAAAYRDADGPDNIGAGNANPIYTDYLGDDVPHETRHPYSVVLLIEKI
ncbi:MAG: phage tail fiber protein [Ferruginibacter sp.]|nr:phage tail fiber protein [Ferruginibacter sp.]